jgi:hypothetical protein
MKIVVIGGTGLSGSELVPKPRTQSHQIVPASPSSGVNTLTGEGLAEIIEGASVVVDVSDAPKFGKTRLYCSSSSLQSATSSRVKPPWQGVGHHVALSVVGSDRMTKGGTLARRSLSRNSFVATWRQGMIRGRLSPIRQRGTPAWR